MFGACCVLTFAYRARCAAAIGCDRWTHIRRAASQLSELPLYLDDTPPLDIRQVLARARLHKRRYGIRLVIVDYLRLVQAPGKDTRIQVGYVADALRQLAKGEKLGVVLLSQLRRPAGGLNQPPTMLDLKESGDIEAHAHNHDGHLRAARTGITAARGCENDGHGG